MPKPKESTLSEHVVDCSRRYDQLRDELSDLREDMAEAKAAREALALDVKALLIAFHHGRGFLSALAWFGLVGTSLVTAGAWLWDHFWLKP